MKSTAPSRSAKNAPDGAGAHQSTICPSAACALRGRTPYRSRAVSNILSRLTNLSLKDVRVGLVALAHRRQVSCSLLQSWLLVTCRAIRCLSHPLLSYSVCDCPRDYIRSATEPCSTRQPASNTRTQSRERCSIMVPTTGAAYRNPT